MRFPQVSVGQRFHYHGKIYSKTGPLTASEEGTGKSRLIMKSAEVTLLDRAGQAEAVKQRFSRQEVEALCSRYRTELSLAVRACAGPQSSLAVQDVLELITKQPLSLE